MCVCVFCLKELPAVEVAEVQQVELSVVLRVVDRVDVLSGGINRQTHSEREEGGAEGDGID